MTQTLKQSHLLFVSRKFSIFFFLRLFNDLINYDSLFVWLSLFVFENPSVVEMMYMMSRMHRGGGKGIHFGSSWEDAWLDVAPAASSSSSSALAFSSSQGCLGFLISDMSRNAENDDCFNWMIVFVHGWYMALHWSEETTGFFGTSWRTSQPVCGMVAKNFIRSSSSGLELSSDSIDWRLKISQNREFAIFNWWGSRALALKGHRFSISLFKSSNESKLSPSLVRSQFDMPVSVGIFKVDTKIDGGVSENR